jgi:FMN phosphatase YigB (HAD superfamily)
MPQQTPPNGPPNPDKKMVIAFDAYGTLLSTESISKKLADHFGEEKGEVLAQAWRKYQLEYTWRLNSMGKYIDRMILYCGPEANSPTRPIQRLLLRHDPIPQERPRRKRPFAPRRRLTSHAESLRLSQYLPRRRQDV